MAFSTGPSGGANSAIARTRPDWIEVPGSSGVIDHYVSSFSILTTPPLKSEELTRVS